MLKTTRMDNFPKIGQVSIEFRAWSKVFVFQGENQARLNGSTMLYGYPFVSWNLNLSFTATMNNSRERRDQLMDRKAKLKQRPEL